MVKTPKGRKRSRQETWLSRSRSRTRTDDTSTPVTSATATDDNTNTLPNKRVRRPIFLGKIFAISSLSMGNDSSSMVSQQRRRRRRQRQHDDDDQNYKGLLSLCQSGGAKVGSQVHKKVFCVVATINAIEGKTQRVRKAWKKGIPVVQVEWVRKCLREGRLLPFGDNLVAASSSSPPNKNVMSSIERKGATLETTADDDDADYHIGVSSKETSLDLGCCCVCHETGKADCEWCINCSILIKKNENVDEPATSKHKTKKDAEGTREYDIVTDRQLDLGCCCVCHKMGRVDCDWCIDCNVSKS